MLMETSCWTYILRLLPSQLVCIHGDMEGGFLFANLHRSVLKFNTLRMTMENNKQLELEMHVNYIVYFSSCEKSNNEMSWNVYVNLPLGGVFLCYKHSSVLQTLNVPSHYIFSFSKSGICFFYYKRCICLKLWPNPAMKLSALCFFKPDIWLLT